MSGPGKGRYTTYVPTSSTRNTLLWKLFNKKAPNDAGVFYGGQEPSNNVAAAAAAVARATADVTNGVGGLTPANGQQVGDAGMFPNGVDLSFGNAPNLSDVKWRNAGDPANSFAPDVSSPGPGKTSGLDKSENPELSIKDFKGETYVPGAPDTGTTSPSTTSEKLGTAPIGKDLEKGKSSV